MGCITPVGNDISTFWSSIVSGKNGIGPITRFDTTDFKAKLAAEVKDFDPNLYMEKAEIRKSDLFAQYGMAAAYQAVQDSGILGKVAPERFGVYVGSGIGGITDKMKTAFYVLNDICLIIPDSLSIIYFYSFIHL